MTGFLPGWRLRSQWLIAFLILLGSEPRWLDQTVYIMDAAAPAVLAADASWSPPLARLLPAQALWPYWLFAIAGATVIVGAVRRLARCFPVWLAATALVGWSLSMQPRDLLPAALVAGAFCVLSAAPRAAGWPVSFVLLLGLAACAVVVSLEFSLVLAALCLGDWSAFPNTMTARQSMVRTSCLIIGPWVAVALAGTLVPGMYPAAMRPISWTWLRPHETLLPSLDPAFRSGAWNEPGLLLGVFVIAAWISAYADMRSNRRESLGVVLFTLLALGCGRYLWLGTYCMAYMLRNAVRPDAMQKFNPLILWSCALLALVRLLPHNEHYVDFAAHGALAPDRIDPARWGAGGRVLLMDLEQAADWQRPDVQDRFPLLMDDRWDVFGSQYPQYAAVCRDLAEDRSDSYLRSDGAWGGYHRWVKAWSPLLLVVSSRDVECIRRLALSPHWKLMGIDARRTIFGSSSEPGNVPQFRRALATLTSLEWPGPHFSGVDPGVIVAASSSDALSVADVLCALRLPYAALRILPAQHDASTEQVRAWSYMELAHRARQQTGRASLLDQYRAVRGMRGILADGELTRGEVLRIAGSLEGLGLFDLADETAGLILAGDRSKVSPTAQEHAKAIQRRARLLRGSVAQLDSSYLRVERELRAALERGDESACGELLPLLDEPSRAVYAAICAASETSATRAFTDLAAATQRPGLPDRLRTEATFYLACLAIESGNPADAIELLEQRVDNQGSPYQTLEELYLKQLVAR